jgi:hypothetical protein
MGFSPYVQLAIGTRALAPEGMLVPLYHYTNRRTAITGANPLGGIFSRLLFERRGAENHPVVFLKSMFHNIKKVFFH